MTWILEPQSFATWSLDRSGMGEIRRITQDGRVRITEQGIIRIIERFGATWSKETLTVNPWTKE